MPGYCAVLLGSKVSGHGLQAMLVCAELVCVSLQLPSHCKPTAPALQLNTQYLSHLGQ